MTNPHNAPKGFTVQNGKATAATSMLLCDAGPALMDTVIFDGASPAGGAVPTGMDLRSGCSLDAAAVRVRHFGGDGVVDEQGADLTMHAGTALGSNPKIYNNGGTGSMV